MMRPGEVMEMALGDAAAWVAAGISAISLGVSLRTRLTLGSRTRQAAINEVLSHWETGSRLRNVTTVSDAYNPGLMKSAVTWREVCHKAITKLRRGPQRDLIIEARKAVIPVESLLNQGMSGGINPVDLDRALEEMQENVEAQMVALAKTVGRPLEPRERELPPPSGATESHRAAGSGGQ
jgi:hypothetical protein